MTPQMKAFVLFLGINAIVIGVFVWVAQSTRREHELNTKSAYLLRQRFFLILSSALLIALLPTWPNMPYPKADARPDRIVYVVGKQFAFGISNQPIRTDEQWEAATYSTPVQVPAGALVEFRVTSFDVNHGFGVYSPEGQLLGQTQAMPGYVNVLLLRLTLPGTYRVYCLELCGMGHDRMRGVFEVTP
jgi:cytochrome c oxidase subunit 2